MMATSITSSGVSKPSSTPFLCSGKNLNSLKTRLATTGKFCKPSKLTPFSITNRLLDSLKPLNADTATSTSTIPVANGGFMSRFAPDEPRKGADVLVEALERAGATVVFSYTGAASMEIHQALARSHIVRNNPCRHQLGGIFAAQGYARGSGRPGVCIATSGPGASNLVSGLPDARLDSVPLVAITGLVAHRLIGTDAFQETPIVEITRTITKHSYSVLDVEDIPRIVQEAFVLAVSGRPGPVLIDIPMHIQQQLVVPTWDKPKDIQQQLVVPTWDKSMQLHGFVEPSGIPAASTLMGLGTYPLHDPFSLLDGVPLVAITGQVPRHLIGTDAFQEKPIVEVTRTITEHIIVDVDKDGAFFLAGSSPVIIDPKPQLVVLPWDKPIQLHGYRMLGMHGTVYANYVVHEADFSAWIEVREKKCSLWFKTCGEAIITTGVGQRQMWVSCYEFKGSRQWATSSGLGPMGFGIPAAHHQMWAQQGHRFNDPRQRATSTGLRAEREMWAQQGYGFNGPRQWPTSSGLGAMGFGLSAAIVVCIIEKLGMVKFFVFFTQKLLEILQFFQTGM